MATPEGAKQKWARKVSGSAWKEGVKGKDSAYCQGVADFLGVSSCSADKKSAWSSGVEAVSASDFDRAVSGKEDKWLRNYREEMAG